MWTIFGVHVGHAINYWYIDLIRVFWNKQRSYTIFEVLNNTQTFLPNICMSAWLSVSDESV